ncbi:uncharacterized protein [Dermacentor albipictus]|uniref:uncharacterized protein n=1 Tax=Dermacentor albipictus TaxID=60249 RepID=UPI0038FCA565
MIGDLDSMSCALWGRGAAPQSELGLFLALVNLLIHLPFIDLPVLRDYELGELRKQYDYVIVGGGSAGCVIANRLSTNPNVTVLLLEAGGLETASRQIPAAAPFNLRGHDDWDYHSVPQSNAALSFREQRLSLSRGKVLGGSSVLNFLLYMRGNPKDYDRWVREYGATGWGYEDVLPHYKEIEDYHAGPLDQYHGSGGEVPVDYANTSTLLSHRLLEACNELGYPYVDYNGPTQSGCSRAQANVANGERFSSSKAFIQAVVGARKNLHVALFSQVTKVNFEGRQAVGVSFNRYGKPQDVLARREVILSAGTVGSAQLLLLSGVGPKEQLERLQIPVIADLPVGRNLQDHVVLQMAPPVSMNVNAGIPPFGLDDIEQYNWNRTGTISIPASTEFLQFLHTDHAMDDDIPDIEIAPISTSPASELFKSAMVELGLLPEAFDGIIGPTDGRLGFRSIVILNRPKSRGAITLRSADPYDHPDIDPRILDHPDDVKRAAEGTRKFIDEVLGTAAMQSIGAEPWNVTFPPCAEAGSLWSQNYTECLFRHAAHTMWHLCCTVAMGSHSEAVLDERLRVRGNVTNLRVADASVMPDIVSGHTHAVAMMIGSKAAAMIIEDNEERQCHDTNVFRAPANKKRSAVIMSGCPNATTACAAPWATAPPAPQSELSLLLALVNLVTHLPFTDLPVLRDYQLGPLRQEYDYVIVGGGSAGSVIANRLSANASVTVLLLEAGGLETPSRQVPAAAPLNLRGHDDWDYWTVPQRNAAFAYRDQRLSLSRGKVLGGSSVLNFMAYTRGNPKDYDRWASKYGAKGWSYEDVLPHFKDIEDYRVGTPDQYHGTGGEVPVNYANTSTRLSQLLVEACKQSSYRYVDFNGATQSGCSRMQTNVADGERYSASKAFIRPIVGARKNLHVALFSQVTKVNFKGKRAMGVSFTRYGQPQNVSARREVILSAGTVGSTQLLLLSGVGPKEQLERLKIPVVADLPVGRNLQDHPAIMLGFPISTDVDAGIEPFSLDDIAQYASNRTGTISIPIGCEFVQFLHTDYSTDPDVPDVEIALISTSPSSQLLKDSMAELGLLPEAFDGLIGPINGRPGFRVVSILNRPKSRGSISLRSADPNDYPDIDPNILEHPDDLMAVAQGTKTFIDRVLNTDAMRSIGAKPWNVTFPPCAGAGARWSRQYIECVFRHGAQTVWHLCCTMAMGTHPEAVLDERLRVRGGLTGLRVADASVMPDIITGHTSAPSMMIGSKAAAIIIEDHMAS